MTDHTLTSDRRTPTRTRAALTDLTLIVRPPHRPAEIRAYTAAELDDAHAYAEAMDTTVEPLP